MRVTHWLLVGLAFVAAGCLDAGSSGDDRPIEHDDDGVPDAEDCAPNDPFRWRLLAAYVDQDQDGYGAGVQVMECFGAAPSRGYSAVGTDCDDADYDAWQLMERYPDADHDQVGTGDRVTVCGGESSAWGFADATGDCAPDDGTRWQELGYLFVDADHDGFTLPSIGLACSGASLPAGYALDPSGVDCDDTEAAAFVLMDGYPDADGDGHGVGAKTTFCTGEALPNGYGRSVGDCAPGDGSRWQELPYSFTDLDGDGYTIASFGLACSGYGLPAGYEFAPASGADCDDGDRSAFESIYAYPDADGDGYGAVPAEAVCTGGWLPAGWVADLYDGIDCDDADLLAWRSYTYAYRDADGDGYRIPSSGVVCYGTSVPAGYTVNSSAIQDCDDANPDLFRALVGAPDIDGDGFGAPPREPFCTGGSLPSGYVADATDCAADDPLAWRSYANPFVDRDGDGHTVREVVTLCIGTTLPAPYLATANGNDCDEGEPALFRWVVLYADQDGDGVGAPPRWIPCLGATLPAGWSVFGYDLDDADAAVQASTVDEVLFTILD